MAFEARSTDRGPLENAQEQNGRGLPVLPVRDTVLFPHAVLPLTVGRESSVNLINSLGEDKTIIVVAQREARTRPSLRTCTPSVPWPPSTRW
jgi:ATP-dependent Lon protease